MGKRRVTFTVAAGSGWIGKAEGRMGRKFDVRQEFTTDDDLMINALEKSGVASIVHEGVIGDDELPVGIPGTLPPIDDTPTIDWPLAAYTNEELRIMCIERGIKAPTRKSKETYIELLQAAKTEE